jgi:hypothetical protein
MSAFMYAGVSQNFDHDEEARAIVLSLLGAGDEVDANEIAQLPPPNSFRRKVLMFLLSRTVEIALLVLLACDVLLLMAELEVDSRKVCSIRWKQNGTVIPAGGIYAKPIECNDAPPIRFDCHVTRDFAMPLDFAPCPFSVAEELSAELHTAEVAIGWISRSIVMLFMIELLSLLACGGPALFWNHKAYILDFVIVLVTLILDGIAATTDVHTIAELIIIARCWRFARIVHGIGDANEKKQGHHSRHNSVVHNNNHHDAHDAPLVAEKQ